MSRVLLEIYPEESVFSWLARSFVRSGYSRKSEFIEEVYGGKRTYPSLLFLGVLDKRFIEWIRPVATYEELLINHTLFKHYVRFVDPIRKKALYEMALSNEVSVEALLPVDKGKKDYYLRYCPLCVEEDRRRYGECYFHINHSFPGVNVCAKHRCRLIDTDTKGTSYRKGGFVCLEELVGRLEPALIDASDVEYMVTKYVDALFKEPLLLETDIRVGDYLSARLQGKYIRRTAGNRRNELIVNDLKTYFANLPDYRMTVYKLQTILLNQKWNPYEVALIALFEGIEAKELASYENYPGVDEVVKPFDWEALDDSLCERFAQITKELGEIERLDINKEWVAAKLGINKKMMREKLPWLLKLIRTSRSQGKWATLEKAYCDKLDDLYQNERGLFLDKVLTFKYIGSLIGVKDLTLRRFPLLKEKVRQIQLKHTIKSNKWLRIYSQKLELK